MASEFQKDADPYYSWLSPTGSDLSKKVSSREVKVEDIDARVEALGNLLTRNDILWLKWAKAALSANHPAIREALYALRDSDDPDLALWGRLIVESEYGVKNESKMHSDPCLPLLSPAGSELSKKVKSREVKVEDIDKHVQAIRNLLTQNDILWLNWARAGLSADLPAIRHALYALRDSDDPDLATFGGMIVESEYGTDSTHQV